jgi:hypothetical protein
LGSPRAPSLPQPRRAQQYAFSYVFLISAAPMGHEDSRRHEPFRGDLRSQRVTLRSRRSDDRLNNQVFGAFLNASCESRLQFRQPCNGHLPASLAPALYPRRISLAGGRASWCGSCLERMRSRHSFVGFPGAWTRAGGAAEIGALTTGAGVVQVSGRASRAAYGHPRWRRSR